MGIWDTIKKAKNFVTGGGAKVSLTILDQAQLKKPFKVRVDIQIEHSEIEADRILLLIKNSEHVKMEVNTIDSSGKQQNRTQQKTNILYKEEIVLDNMVLLHSQGEYSYESEVSLPPEVFPAIEGVNARFTWSLQAVIDKSGNNPESKVQYFEPKYEIR